MKSQPLLKGWVLPDGRVGEGDQFDPCHGEVECQLSAGLCARHCCALFSSRCPRLCCLNASFEQAWRPCTAQAWQHIAASFRVIPLGWNWSW